MGQWDDPVTGCSYPIEQEFVIQQFEYMVEAGDGVSKRSVVFYAKDGGCRVIPVDDVVQLR
jgi:hypothetical protein